MKKKLAWCLAALLLVVLMVILVLFFIINQAEVVISHPDNTDITNISTYHKTKYQTAVVEHLIVDEETEAKMIDVLSGYSMKKTEYETESIENNQANFVITLIDGNIEKTIWIGKVNLCEVKSESYVGEIENTEELLSQLNEICKIVEAMKERDERFGITYDDLDAYNLIS